jgi:EpsI family protein
MKSARFWTVLILLLATAFVLQSRGDTDNVPQSEPLSLMPQTFDNLTAQDLPLDDDTLAVLGKGEFLNRIYSDQQAGIVQPISTTPSIGLFIGYFPTQRTGQTMHSPQNCLPGAGWVFDSHKYVTIQDDQGKDLNVGEYVISNSGFRQFVIYWYQAHGRSVPNEYAAKAYMVADAIRTNRTDGALVRVTTQVAPNESLQSAQQRAVHFTQQMAPYLPRFIPN